MGGLITFFIAWGDKNQEFKSLNPLVKSTIVCYCKIRLFQEVNICACYLVVIAFLLQGHQNIPPKPSSYNSVSSFASSYCTKIFLLIAYLLGGKKRFSNSICFQIQRKVEKKCPGFYQKKILKYFFLRNFNPFLLFQPMLPFYTFIKHEKQRYNTSPAGNYMLKVNSRNIRTRCEICSKLTIKALECLYC